MQSVVKRSEGSNIYKLSDHLTGDQDAASDGFGDTMKKPVPEQGDDRVASADLDAGRTPAAEHNPDPVEAAPSSPDDALAWLKIIQNATADLTADIRSSRGSDPARSVADEETEFGRRAQSWPASNAGNVRRNPGFHDDARHDDYSDERKLAEKLSYRNAEPRHAPSQSLMRAVLPYAAATGLLAFLAGCAAVYFLSGSSTGDVRSKTAAPASETQAEPPLARPEQPIVKKGSIQRTAPPSGSGDGAVSLGLKGAEQGKPAEPAAPDDHQQSWSDTVETFKQFVRPEQK